MKHTAVWSHLVAAVLGALIAVAITLTLTSNDESRIEIGDTFTATVESYFGPDSDHKNSICFKLEDSPCGQPILGDDDMVVKAGQEVTATWVWIDSDDSSQRAVVFVHPAD